MFRNPQFVIRNFLLLGFRVYRAFYDIGMCLIRLFFLIPIGNLKFLKESIFIDFCSCLRQ